MKKHFCLPAILAIALASSMLIPFSSCEKETVTIETTVTDTVCITSALGLWEGTFTTDQVSHAPGKIGFALYSDGKSSQREFGNNIYSPGSYVISNNQITISDTTINNRIKVIRKVTFTYDSENDLLTNGKWEYVSSTSGTMYTGSYSTLQKVK